MKVDTVISQFRPTPLHRCLGSRPYKHRAQDSAVSQLPFRFVVLMYKVPASHIYSYQKIFKSKQEGKQIQVLHNFQLVVSYSFPNLKSQWRTSNVFMMTDGFTNLSALEPMFTWFAGASLVYNNKYPYPGLLYLSSNNRQILPCTTRSGPRTVQYTYISFVGQSE